MNPTFDLKGEHDAMAFIITAMKRISCDIRNDTPVDLFRFGQIIEFLKIYLDHCHNQKEEKVLFPALLGLKIPKINDTILKLLEDHIVARTYVTVIETGFNRFLSGQSLSMQSLPKSIDNFCSLVRDHLYVEEKTIFPLVEKSLDAKQQENIAGGFAYIQDHEVGHEKCEEYYILLSRLYSETKYTTIPDRSGRTGKKSPGKENPSGQPQHTLYVSG